MKKPGIKTIIISAVAIIVIGIELFNFKEQASKNRMFEVVMESNFQNSCKQNVAIEKIRRILESHESVLAANNRFAMQTVKFTDASTEAVDDIRRRLEKIEIKIRSVQSAQSAFASFLGSDF